MKLGAVAFGIALGVIVAASSQAGSGQIEINQASVTAAGGFPFVIANPGSYVLTGDLVVPNENTTGISITGKGVTLDLAGFGVRGPVTCSGSPYNTACSASGSGIGISVGSAATAVIHDGFVRGMGSVGISAYSTFGTVIENMVVEENAGHGVDLYEGRIVESTVRFNGANGITQCDCGAAGSNQIDHNVVERNRGAGIRAGYGTVKDNFINANGAQGVYVAGAGGNAIHLDGNTIQSNAGNGLSVSSGVYRNNMLRSNLQTTGHQVVGGVTDGGGNYCSPAC